jgi:hypothetical protein
MNSKNKLFRGHEFYEINELSNVGLRWGAWALTTKALKQIKAHFIFDLI